MRTQRLCVMDETNKDIRSACLHTCVYVAALTFCIHGEREEKSCICVQYEHLRHSERMWEYMSCTMPVQKKERMKAVECVQWLIWCDFILFLKSKSRQFFEMRQWITLLFWYKFRQHIFSSIILNTFHLFNWSFLILIYIGQHNIETKSNFNLHWMYSLQPLLELYFNRMNRLQACYLITTNTHFTCIWYKRMNDV